MASTSQARGAAPAAADAPFGLSQHNLHPPRRTWARIVLAALLLLPLGSALLGWLGGGPSGRTTAHARDASLSVEMPRIVRSGNWFETRIVATPTQDIANLTVAVDRPLWRRMSIDTFAPDAGTSSFQDGAFRYGFGAVAAGDRFEIKLDGQIQSWGYRRLRGDITLLDGERRLARVPLTLTVLP